MNVQEKLDYIDREYLSQYDYQKVDSRIHMAIDYQGPKKETYSYSLSEAEELTDKTFLSYNVVMGTSLDPELYMAMQLLQSVLFDVPGAPVKEALIRAGIGMDIESSYDTSIQQPIFSVIAHNANEEELDRFVEIIDQTLTDISEHGIDKKALQGAINHMEFQLREADYGRYPKGLMYGLMSFDSWLYDEHSPFIHIKVEETLGFMKRGVENGYFERLIRNYFLDNPHKSYVVFKPEYGLNEKKEAETRKKLAEYKASLTNVEIDKVIRDTKNLKEYQAEPSSEEDLRKIPLLEIEDIEPKIQAQQNVVRDLMGIPTIVHPFDTNGIVYLNLCFKLNKMDPELLPYVNLLSYLLGKINTDKYSYNELVNEIRLKSGSINSALEIRRSVEPDEYLPTFNVRAKMLYSQVEDTFRLLEEMLLHSKLEETDRLRELIAEAKTGMKPELLSRGHVTASRRAASYIAKDSYIAEQVKGVPAYEFLADLDGNFDAKKDELVSRLKQVLEEILHKETLVISYTGDQDVQETIGMNVALFSVYLST